MDDYFVDWHTEDTFFGQRYKFKDLYALTRLFCLLLFLTNSADIYKIPHKQTHIYNDNSLD